MITDYRVISEVGIPAFEEKVNKAISDGWQPFGSLIVDGFMLIQAMVQEEIQIESPLAVKWALLDE